MKTMCLIVPFIKTLPSLTSALFIPQPYALLNLGLVHSYIGLVLIQMLKALMPVAVYSIRVLLGKECFSSKTTGNMVGISLGVAIVAYGEAQFNSRGVMLQLGAVVFEATQLVLSQILLTAKGISLNSITSLYHLAPCCFVFLSIPWAIIEFPVLATSSSFYLDVRLFSANCACAFLLNLGVFIFVGKTSTLTMNVAVVVKDWLLIALSWSVIKDRVTGINLLGYGLAFLGFCFYNHLKLHSLKVKEAQKKVLDGDEDPSRLLGQNPNTEGKNKNDANV